jgi:tight adherence protein B
MVGALAPYAIVLGGAIAVALIFSSVWSGIAVRVRSLGSFYARELDIGDIKIKSEDLGYIVLAVATMLWVILILVFRPSPLVGVLYLAIVFGLSGYGVKYYLQARVKARIGAFQKQFEGVMRSLVSGVRVGLGLRQALVHVTEQSKDPARKELTRVIGTANLGTSLFDALDELGQRMAFAESQMMARVIRVQSQAGGDLASVLEHLADTIRDRRRLARRISALTAQARASAWVLGGLPLFFLAFIMLTQPALRDALLYTFIGHVVVFLAVALDIMAIFVLVRMTRLDA